MVANPFNWLLGLFSLDLGIDLGTANTLIYVRGKGIIVQEPSWVAIEKRSRKPIAIGTQAKQMVGRTPANVITIRPIRDGVISEFEITQAMLAYFIGRVHQQAIVPMPRPRVVIGIPSGATEVEKRAVYDAAMAAGAREVYLIEEPIAASLGAGLPLADVAGSMIVDIGGGTSEIAVCSMGGIVVSRSLRVAGDEMDQDIIEYVRNKYSLFVGERMAEQIKWEIGSAYPFETEKTMQIKGRNLINGLPEAIEISSIEIREALNNSIQVIIDTIKSALDEVPPEIGADLLDTGICLAGGGSLLNGMVLRLAEELKMHVWLAEDPMTCVARGAGIVLEDLDRFKSLLVDIDGNRQRI
ncbi:MAG TPA: rod shape-determining protein [Anaerolineaceae bacterium]|nr:rod shape-determining protein [Anaerolineaceae bacterium]